MAINWKKAMAVTERHALTTQAKCTGDKMRAAELRMEGGHWVLAILGTQGSWRLTSIADVGDGDSVAIDFGSGSACTNVRALVSEANALVNRSQMRSV